MASNFEHLAGLPLTRRERTVIVLLAEGLQNKQIAGQLGLATCSVNQYVARILAKSSSSNRVQAAMKWTAGRIAVKGQASARA
jgi:DNA-binding NarL/FixJ family response regulator